MFGMCHNSMSEGQIQSKDNDLPGCQAWPLRPAAGCGLVHRSLIALRETHPQGVAEKRAGPLITYSHIYDTSTPTDSQVATFRSDFELVTQRDQLPEDAGCMMGKGAAGSVLEIFKIVAAYM
jgi:hypothetical protein